MCEKCVENGAKIASLWTASIAYGADRKFDRLQPASQDVLQPVTKCGMQSKH